MGKSKDWVVWCRSRKKDEEQGPFEVDEKETSSNCSKQAKPKAGEKTDKKGGKGQSVRWKARWRQGNIKCAVSEENASCWVHQDCHVADEPKAALKKAAEVSGGKDECQVRLKVRERDYWMGTEIGMLGGYGFHGQVTAHDGSDKQGKMGAGYDNLRRKKKKQQSRYAAENRFEQICSRESLTEKAVDIEKTISVKETKGNAMISTRQYFMKIVFGIGG